MITYFAPYSFGGSADYSLCQINALLEEGIEIEAVAPPKFLRCFNESVFHKVKEIRDRKPRHLPIIYRAALFLYETLSVFSCLKSHLRKTDSSYVLLGDFSEYLSPIWQPMLKAEKKRKNLRFGCILHDPVRNFVRGPRCWHDRSVKRAFELLDDIFIHGPAPDTFKASYPHLNVVEVPHGVYSADVIKVSKKESRERLGLPTNATVLLQFGHIRDGKNIDLLIQSMNSLPNCHLVIAGKVVSGTQHGEAYYRELAVRAGVEARVHFHFGFIPSDRIPLLFGAADCCCLVYNSSFKSMSGVLAHAINYETAVVASGGEGPMKTIVSKYQLGEWLDDVDGHSLSQAVERILGDTGEASDWVACRSECSWERNSALVAATIRLHVANERSK